MAAPTPPLRSRETSRTRVSSSARTAWAVPSVEPSSTTSTRSTKSGMPAMVVAISCSSSCAGTTTATRFPSTTRALLHRGRAVPAHGEAVGGERRPATEQEADERAHERGVAAALSRRAGGNGGLDDTALLDELRLREQLPGVQQLGLHGAAPLLGEADR